MRTVFVELGGKGFGSINYDYRFAEHHSITAGITMLDYTWIDYNKVDSLAYFTLPTPSIMYHYLRGKNGHHLELGLGASLLPYWGVDYGENDSPYSFHGTVGYRYQKQDKIFIRAGVYPFYRLNWMFLPLPGVSVGYSW